MAWGRKKAEWWYPLPPISVDRLCLWSVITVCGLKHMWCSLTPCTWIAWEVGRMRSACLSASERSDNNNKWDVIDSSNRHAWEVPCKCPRMVWFEATEFMYSVFYSNNDFVQCSVPCGSRAESFSLPRAGMQKSLLVCDKQSTCEWHGPISRTCFGLSSHSWFNNAWCSSHTLLCTWYPRVVLL